MNYRLPLCVLSLCLVVSACASSPAPSSTAWETYQSQADGVTIKVPPGAWVPGRMIVENVSYAEKTTGLGDWVISPAQHDEMKKATTCDALTHSYIPLDLTGKNVTCEVKKLADGTPVIIAVGPFRKQGHPTELEAMLLILKADRGVIFSRFFDAGLSLTDNGAGVNRWMGSLRQMVDKLKLAPASVTK